MNFKEVIFAGLTMMSCNTQDNAPDLTDSARKTRTDVETVLTQSVPTEADLTRGQLTGACTPTDWSLQGEQFPMVRGTKLLKTLDDGTCLEESLFDGDYNIYAINGNKKIKFMNPDPNQKTRILAQNDFDTLQTLGITFLEEIQTARTAQTLRVLFEGPIDDCPKYRYRRSMLAGTKTTMGGECVWDEIRITCPTIRTATSSSDREWQAFFEKDHYVIPGTGMYRTPDKLNPGIAPKPSEWLGTQPQCPESNSVVNIDINN